MGEGAAEEAADPTALLDPKAALEEPKAALDALADPKAAPPNAPAAGVPAVPNGLVTEPEETAGVPKAAAAGAEAVPDPKPNELVDWPCGVAGGCCWAAPKPPDPNVGAAPNADPAEEPNEGPVEAVGCPKAPKPPEGAAGWPKPEAAGWPNPGVAAWPNAGVADWPNAGAVGWPNAGVEPNEGAAPAALDGAPNGLLQN